MLKTIGTAAAKHKWWFFGGWIALIVGLIVASSALPGETQNNFSIPGTESQQAEDLLTEDFPRFVNASVKVVYQATDGSELTSSSNTSAIESAVDNLSKIEGVSSASDPTKTPNDLIALSSDKTIGFTTVTFDTTLADVSNDAFDEIEQAAQPAVTAGLNVQYSGPLIDIQDPVPPGISEYADEIGLGLAAIILLLSFGSVVAMGLPLGTALFALVVSATSLAILEHFFTIGGINVTFGTMIGLGVGVDYSLLILNRYLQDRASGDDVVTATGAAVNTAGRAVLFAGVTISIAVIALTVFGVPYLSTLGLTSAMFVMFTVLAALTLLPAFIGMAGRHIESIRLPFIKKRSEVDPADPTAFWARWSRTSVHARGLLVPLGVVVLGAIALPALSADLGFIDDGDDPEGTTEREAYDLIAEGFGPGANGPLLVAIDLSPGATTGGSTSTSTTVETSESTTTIAATTTTAPTTATTDATGTTDSTDTTGTTVAGGSSSNPLAGETVSEIESQLSSLDLNRATIEALAELVVAINRTDGVASALGPIPNDGATAAVIEVTPTGAPSSSVTQDLTRTLRQQVIPNTLDGSSVNPDEVFVGGETAVLIDLTDRISSRLILFIGVVLLAAFVLLMTVFRSVLVPLKAVLLNVLMFLAAYGIMVAVFQWGWGNGIVGVPETVVIESFVPVIVFAVLFGLSTDYEVFLLSRIREEYDRTGDAEQSVVVGTTTTARVIASAALIMTAVFLSFVTNPAVVVKMIGLPLGLGILLDAFIVRLTIVPGLMRFLGGAAWWMPGWLDKILPTIHIDDAGSSQDSTPVESAAGTPAADGV
ncbi:MAG: MMPL family transporter [Actinomycetota bacterium]